MIHSTDIDLTAKQVTELTSPDALTAWLGKLGFETAARATLTPESVGLAGDAATAFKRIELLSEDSEQFLRVVFAQSKSLTAKSRNDLVRVLGKSNIDHMLVLAADFDTLEFVFLDKRKREKKGPVGVEGVQVIPKTISVSRRSPTRLDLRSLRRFTWTCRDGLEQFDKLRSVFDAAAYTGEYFQNRGLFSDYFLRDRLREDTAWRDNPSDTFAFVRDSLKDAQTRWTGKDKDAVRKELLEPLFKKLGFKATVNRPSRTEHTQPDYLLKDSEGRVISAAFVYPWDRWLDGPDLRDGDTPEENPGACVVTALDQGQAEWIIVTNGRLWRLYSKHAHARATNFYEVDLVEALTASGDTDPNEAFRYWWLFFRLQAFQPTASSTDLWLDVVLRGCRDYAKRLGDRLKNRVFFTIFPHLAQGFLEDRKLRLGVKKEPTEDELADIFEATLTLLYRLLFLLYAESRDLLPIREAPYSAASLKRIKEEIADKAGVAASEVAEKLEKAFSGKDTKFYDRLCLLFQAMDKGDPVLNVPTYNGGLFNTKPDESKRRDQEIARFLVEHKVPDRYLALAIDRLSRDQDERTLALGFIDYKSLEVRHLGSIYEGLLEFKLRIADEDLTTQVDKDAEKYIKLSEAKVKRGRHAEIVVRKKEVYLSNDKFERKASGSYYTPDAIVEYIVANTVGPVLEEKLTAIRPEFRKVRKTFDNEVQKAKSYPPAEVRSRKMDERQWAAAKTYAAHKDLVEKLFDLKVLDPAMGSGHFLVEVVDFVTDRLLNFLNQFPINPVSYALDRTRTRILESLGQQGVTVNPDKLTDINLLKRHVLKRCIYGVDLNPMAVELAKVSLWLDAFTLGAPLSFLDHHLRCGNSLVGATLDDLQEAVQPSKGYSKQGKRAKTMFALNYEPLLRAINHVLFVSNLADATASEVSSSASQYDLARKSLSGYKVILDLIVAGHFGLPKAAELVTFGSEYNLSDHDSFLSSLNDDKERKLVQQVDELANRPDRRFFHWEIEFPEIFFGFADKQHRQIQHKEKIATGSAGFDCVVGNPPYGPLDTELRPFVFTHFATTGGKPDIYSYFIEQAPRLLKNSGMCGQIAPNTWLTLKTYGPLRKHLLSCTALCSILDTLGIFEDAWVNTVVVILGNSQPSNVRCHVYVPIKATSATEQLQNIANHKWHQSFEIAQLYWAASDDSVISYTTDPTSQKIINIVSERFSPLSDHFEVTTGYQVYHNTRHTPEEIRGRAFHTTKPSNKKFFKRCFGGTDVSRYKWSYSSDEYVIFGDNLYRSPPEHFFTGPKILVQEIFGRGLYKVSAALAEEPVYYDKSCLGVVAKSKACDRLALRALLGVLNSKYATWYFVVAGNKAYGTGDFARLTKKDLAILPVPQFVEGESSLAIVAPLISAISVDDPDEAMKTLTRKSISFDFPFDMGLRKAIAALVDRIIECERDALGSVRVNRSSLSPKAQAYQDVLERIVYLMAGLDDSEVAALEQRVESVL